MNLKNLDFIKLIAIVLIIASSVIIVTNIIGMVAIYSLTADLVIEDEPTGNFLVDFLVVNYSIVSWVMIGMGSVMLLTSIYLRLYRNWARRLTQYLLALMFVIVCISLLAIHNASAFMEVPSYFPIVTILSAIFYSFPIVVLIMYLNKEHVKSKFA
ncbi:MAG: hypothetical protein ACK4ND_09080 [Cytophagaceae bacterium]